MFSRDKCQFFLSISLVRSLGHNALTCKDNRDALRDVFYKQAGVGGQMKLLGHDSDTHSQLMFFCF